MQLSFDDYFKEFKVPNDYQGDFKTSVMRSVQFSNSPGGLRSYGDQTPPQLLLREQMDPSQVQEAFSKGNMVSSILPDLINSKNTTFDVRGFEIRNPGDFAQLCIPLRTPYFESFKFALLNKNKKIIHSEVLTMGSLKETLIDNNGLLRRIHEKYKVSKAQSLIVSHNHPSGDPEPSHADLRATQQIEHLCSEIGMQFFGHIITNGKKFSMIQKNEITGGIYPSDVQKNAPWELISRDDLKTMNPGDDFSSIANALRNGDDSIGHVLYLNAKRKLTAIERFPLNASESEMVKKMIVNSAREGAAGFLLDVPDNNIAYNKFINVGKRVASLSDVIFSDIGSKTTPSYAAAGVHLFESFKPGIKFTNSVSPLKVDPLLKKNRSQGI